ncbi:MAG: hypothetical protein ACYCQJ_15935 [Nitrososphaerales archaeon]
MELRVRIENLEARFGICPVGSRPGTPDPDDPPFSGRCVPNCPAGTRAVMDHGPGHRCVPIPEEPKDSGAFRLPSKSGF